MSNVESFATVAAAQKTKLLWPNPQEIAYLVTFTKEILNGRHYFLCSELTAFSFITYIFVGAPATPLVFFLKKVIVSQVGASFAQFNFILDLFLSQARPMPTIVNESPRSTPKVFQNGESSIQVDTFGWISS